jgi:Transglutaminase-like superfamily
MLFEKWCGLSDRELAAQDTAVVNLTAAAGLADTATLDIPSLLEKLNRWVGVLGDRIAQATQNRSRYSSCRDMTDAEFRVAMFVTVLQRDLGVHYNVAFTEGRYDARDSRNFFLHGPLSGFGGTCNSLPVLYVALMRRLGYPVKLVQTKEHYFCRWDRDGERFNIEATCLGFNSYPDERYLEWPLRVSLEEARANGYLQELVPREELAEFISARGHCLMDNLRSAEAVECFYHAANLASEKMAHVHEWARAVMTHHVMEECKRSQRKDGLVTVRLPPIREEWQRPFAREAVQNMNRILANRGALQLGKGALECRTQRKADSSATIRLGSSPC